MLFNVLSAIPDQGKKQWDKSGANSSGPKVTETGTNHQEQKWWGLIPELVLVPRYSGPAAETIDHSSLILPPFPHQPHISVILGTPPSVGAWPYSEHYTGARRAVLTSDL